MFHVYSKPNCTFCDQAKALLSAKGLPFQEFVLDVGQPKSEGSTYISRDELLALIPTARTMPQIMAGDEYVGGFAELKTRLS